MKRFFWGLLVLLGSVWLVYQVGVRSSSVFDQPPVTALPSDQTNSTDQEAAYMANLPDYGAAPEISNESWLNVDHPLRLAGLRGKVVLLDMWTFGCINCIHVIPSVRDWHNKYSDQGLVIIANHFPEFSYEHDIVNLRAAMQQLDVPYAVTQDNDGATWSAYSNRYWPTMYLIDKNGHLRYRHIGEGAYDTTEQAIQDLLRESYTPPEEAVSLDALTSLTPTADLNVRSSPGEDSSIIGSIQPGETFVVRGEQDGWYRILYNDQEGYVSADYVTIASM